MRALLESASCLMRAGGDYFGEPRHDRRDPRPLRAMPERLARARREWKRPLTLAEKILVAHAHDFGSADLGAGPRHAPAARRPRGDAGRHRPDGAPPVHAGRQGAGGGALDDALRPPDPRAVRRLRGHEARRHREQRGLRLPPLGLAEVRHRLLEAGLGDHPPGRAGELRVPGRPDDRRRLPHAERRRPRHAGHRRRAASTAARSWRGCRGRCSTRS